MVADALDAARHHRMRIASVRSQGQFRGICTLALAGLLLTLGCASGSDGYRREIERVLSAPRTEFRRVGPPSELVTQPWEVGQWVLYRTKERGEVGYSKMGVVGRGQCGFWLETVTQTTKTRVAVKICIHSPMNALNGTNVSSAIDEIRFLVVQLDEQEAQAFDFREARNMRIKGTFKTFVNQIENSRWGELSAKRDDIEVPAGHFAKHFR